MFTLIDITSESIRLLTPTPFFVSFPFFHLYYFVAVIMSLLNLIFQAALNPLIWISSLLGMFVGVAAPFQQHKLTQVEAMAQTNERLSSEVDQLTAENVRLHASVQQMEESVLK